MKVAPAPIESVIRDTTLYILELWNELMTAILYLIQLYATGV